jgi:Flp pilus assembly protein TadG
MSEQEHTMSKARSSHATPSRRGRDRGAAAVEFALVSIPLLVLVAGLIQFGFVFYSQITITQAAREGARALSLQVPCDAACVSAVESRVTNAAAPAVTPTFDVVQGCAPGATYTSSAVVEVHYQASLFGVYPVTVTGKASMPCGG